MYVYIYISSELFAILKTETNGQKESPILGNPRFEWISTCFPVDAKHNC